MTALVPLAVSGEAAKAGPLGFLVLLALCVACYFLFKSMSKHMRNVRENFPTDAPPTVLPEPPDPSRLPAEVRAEDVPPAAQP